MGQRHQIYIRLNREDWVGDFPDREAVKTKRVYGYHHQWLYGKTAVKTLARLLEFAGKAVDGYGCLAPNSLEASKALESVISLDHEAGRFHSVWPFQDNRKESENCPEPLKDPRRGDNNNGITIIDLTGAKPKYAFVSIGYLECLRPDVRHPKGGVNAHKHTPRASYQNFEPLSAMDWLNLHYDLNEDPAKAPEADREPLLTHLNQCVELLSRVEGFEVLTRDECLEIFPDMYPKPAAKVKAAAKPAKTPRARPEVKAKKPKAETKVETSGMPSPDELQKLLREAVRMALNEINKTKGA